MGLQIELVEVFLENFHTFCISNDIESRYIIMDILSAIRQAPLTQEEKAIIQKLYIDAQEPPERDREAKNGHTNGRPLGGTTQTAVGVELGIEKSTLSVMKKSAIEKIAAYLGEEYVS
jgi:DNA-directed RNA polymerase specialized sigma subunit